MHHPNPWADAAQREVVIHHIWLPDHIDALWVPDVNTILLNDRLNQAERRSALAHELAHIDLEHDPAAAAETAWAQEVAADHVAARALIPIDNLVEAILWSQDESEVADVLWVDDATVRTRLAGLTEAEKHTIDTVLRDREWEVYGEEETA